MHERHVVFVFTALLEFDELKQKYAEECAQVSVS